MIVLSFWILLVVTIFLFLPFTAKILMRPPRHFGRRPLEGGPKMFQRSTGPKSARVPQQVDTLWLTLRNPEKDTKKCETGIVR